MVLTFSEAKLLLQQLNIPIDIQNKILLLFIEFGTSIANIIKQECLKLNSISHYNDNVKTLWRLKLYNSNYSTTIKKYYNKPNISQYELSIATFYPYPESNMVNRQLINTVIKTYLYRMFYNLDKFHYGEYGTLTANIIRNAITNNIIKCSE
jgi:hypothetical protein